MANKEEFNKRLQSLLTKYEKALESRDTAFLSDYMLQCLDRETVLPPRSHKPGKDSNWKRLLNVLIKIILILFLLSGALLFAKQKLENDSGNVYAKDANYWTYFARRWIVRLGLNNFITMQKFYDADCFIRNPLAKSEPGPCLCGYQLKQYKLNSTELARKAFVNKLKSGSASPFIMKNVMEYPVSYSDLRNLVLNEAKDFDSGNSFVYTLTGKGVGSNYKYIFSDPEGPPTDSVVAWDMNFVAVAHHLRKLFPRPFFVNPEQEIMLSRTLFFYGAKEPNTPAAISKHSSSKKAGAYYIQAWGSRVLALKSPAHCKCQKSVLVFKMNQGDLLFFNGDYHELHAYPTKSSPGYGLGYMGASSVEIAKSV